MPNCSLSQIQNLSLRTQESYTGLKELLLTGFQTGPYELLQFSHGAAQSCQGCRYVCNLLYHGRGVSRMGTMDAFHGRCLSCRFSNQGTSSDNDLSVKLVHLQNLSMVILLQHADLVYPGKLPQLQSAAPSCED